ncbi:MULTISPECIES: sigma factor [Methylobacterium]|uniref:sigma factor n=1 Tax=Methylobacterium TaxID=407 RepID=UPI002F3537CF
MPTTSPAHRPERFTVKPADEVRDPAGAPESVISHVHAQLGHRLRQYYSEVEPIEIGSRLVGALDRLVAALDATEVGHRILGAFKDDLIAPVPRLRRYALSPTFDGLAADDLVQLTLLEAWEHRQRFQPGTGLVAWLFTILRNGFINGRRKRRLEVSDLDGLHAATLSEPTAQEHGMGLKEVQAAIDCLEPAYCEALILLAVDGLPRQAAAASAIG